MHSYENAEMSYACDQQAEIDRLKAINAELRAALSDLLFNVQYGNGAAAWEDSKETARAALAKE